MYLSKENTERTENYGYIAQFMKTILVVAFDNNLYFMLNNLII